MRLRPGLLALTVATAGCFAYEDPPAWWRPEPAAGGRGCPDLAGSYANAATADPEGAAPPPPPIAGSPPRVRHLAAFFAGVTDPSRFDRVAISSTTPGTLEVDLFERTAPALHVALREGVDYACRGGEVVFERSPRLVRRDGGSLRFGRRQDGCLLEHTRYSEGFLFLLVVPVANLDRDEWSLFCGGPP